MLPGLNKHTYVLHLYATGIHICDGLIEYLSLLDSTWGLELDETLNI